MSLIVNNVSKTYKFGLFGNKKFKALHNVSFELKSGEVLALIGQNGAGKTTLIKCILGFIKPDEGHILINSKAISVLIHEGKLGYMPETLTYPGYITLFEYITDLMILRGKKMKDFQQRLDELIEKFYMIAHIKKSMTNYSKGTQKKAAYIQSALHSPYVLILDEPTDGLDPVSRRVLLDEIIELKKNGCIVIITTHILLDLNTVADRVILLQNGSIVRNQLVSDISDTLEEWYFQVLLDEGSLGEL